jgi:hypothetical protein
MVWEHDKMNPLAFWTFEDCWYQFNCLYYVFILCVRVFMQT